uniref:Uncharacterized protein n=1 Tax=Daphnia galeata TaxID=27404 RepID=A0A8J2WRJ5_9CRUS|nr:unnamed protein product [Daphnia galeata]
MENSTSLKHVDPDWYKTVEGEKTVFQLYNPNNTKVRKHFGILEHPNVTPGTPEIIFKIGVLGKAGSGKTKTISVLSGKPAVFPGYIETIGIHACMEKTDAVAIVVNRADRTSLDYADSKLDSLSQLNSTVVLFVMDTDLDVQVHDQELSQYARRRRLPFFHLPPHTLDIKYFAPFYNSLCDFVFSSQHKVISDPL